eukprot:scaffold601794_cov21-Prasinocladus_malaysianus.AAC.1
MPAACNDAPRIPWLTFRKEVYQLYTISSSPDDICVCIQCKQSAIDAPAAQCFRRASSSRLTYVLSRSIMR